MRLIRKELLDEDCLVLLTMLQQHRRRNADDSVYSYTFKRLSKLRKELFPYYIISSDTYSRSIDRLVKFGLAARVFPPSVGYQRALALTELGYDVACCLGEVYNRSEFSRRVEEMWRLRLFAKKTRRQSRVIVSNRENGEQS